MPAAISAHEELQLSQTIEMFEVITQTQPLDCQSLEILKDAYLRLDRHGDALNTAKRIAAAYIQIGQVSSAILEYENILQACPNDPEVKAALARIGNGASDVPASPMAAEPEPPKAVATTMSKKEAAKPADISIDDGREAMYKLFVGGRQISAGDFDLCWPSPTVERGPGQIADPFVQVLAQRQLLPVETSLKLICDRTRLGYMLIDKYDVDVDVARNFPRELCQRWCILPFDRMSKSIFVATANPFNKHAARELAKTAKYHLVWYVAGPQELVRTIGKIFR